MKLPTNTSEDLQQIVTVTRYELLKHLRRKRLYAVMAIATLVCTLYLILPPALGLPYASKAEDFAQSFFSQTALFITIAGAFFAGDAIASEFEHKTGYIIFPNPIRRTTLVLGKFIAAFLSVLLVVVLVYGIGSLSMLGIYGSVSIEVAASFSYAILYICSVLGLTFLFSSIFKGSMGATLFSFFLLFMILPIPSSILGSFGGIEPLFDVTYAARIITQVFITPPPERHIERYIEAGEVKMTIHAYNPDVAISILVMTSYFIVTFAMCLLITNRKELT